MCVAHAHDKADLVHVKETEREGFTWEEDDGGKREEGDLSDFMCRQRRGSREGGETMVQIVVEGWRGQRRKRWGGWWWLLLHIMVVPVVFMCVWVFMSGNVSEDR